MKYQSLYMRSCLSVFSSFRVFLSGCLVMCIVMVSVVADVSAVQAMDETPVVGSFGIGGGLSGGVDERTGKFTTEVPLVSLPGVVKKVGDEGVEGAGGFDLSVSYRQSASGGADRFGLGAAWGWDVTFVDTNGGVRVFSASGGMFEADASWPSGLARYMPKDLVFSQVDGVLPARVNVVEEKPSGGSEASSYAYILEYAGGVKEYFNSAGDLLARVDVFGERVDFIWGSAHRLLGVVDAAGSRVDLVWDDTHIEVVSSARGDGVVAKTLLEMSGNTLVSVMNPVGERMKFGYTDDGAGSDVLYTLTSDVGALTEVSYQHLPDNNTVVDQIRVIDASGTVLSSRQWKNVGDYFFTGWPQYQSEGDLWSSGDGTYQYQTVVSDSVTDVVSTYNSLGLLVSRDMVVTTTAGGDAVVRNQQFTFPEMEDGKVPDPQMLPASYAKPTHIAVMYGDGTGRTRTVSEEMEYNERGEVVKHVSADGAVTETVYDAQVPERFQLPLGQILEHTTTGIDGAVSKTVNLLTPDRRSIRSTETFTGTVGGDMVSKTRTEMIVNPDGFVSEERVVASVAKQSQTPGMDAPDDVATRFDRVVDEGKKTVTLTQTDAVGTSAESTSSVVVDLFSGLVVSRVDPTGRVATTTFDSVGRVMAETDFTGLRSTVEYGEKVTRTRDPKGVTRSEYVNVVGQTVKITDNIGKIGGGSGDGSGEAEGEDSCEGSTADAGGVFGPVPGYERIVETRRYEQNSSRVVSTDAHGLETVTVSDVFGRPVRVTAPDGVTQVSVHDDVANTTTTGIVPKAGADISEALQRSTTYRDARNRDVRVTGSRRDGVGVPEQAASYDGLGRAIEQTSSDVRTRMTLNPDGTPKTTTMTPVTPDMFPGDPVTAEREYDFLGLSTKKTLTQNGQSRAGVARVRDAAGRTVSETDQAGKTTTYEYTVDGLTSTIRDEGARVVTRNMFDPVTRAVTRTETIGSDGSLSITAFEYDPVTGKPVAVFDPSDREHTQIRYTYDIFENMISTVYPDGKTVTHVFDDHGRKTSTTDVGGNTSRFKYNRYGVLIAVTQTMSDGETFSSVEYEYDTYGRVIKLSRTNGVTTEYTYTSANEIKTEKTTQGTRLVYEGIYEYDSHGNVSRKTQTEAEPETQTEPETEQQFVGVSVVATTTLYAYDAFDRLVSSSVYEGSDGVSQPQKRVGYEVNVSGDVTKETTTYTSHPGDAAAGTELSEATTVRDFEYNLLGHLVAVSTDGVRVTQEYDPAGNLTTAVDGTRYTYNSRNQPTTETHPDGTLTAMTYWATGDRATITTNADIIGLYWDGDALINDTHTTGVEKITASYLMGITRHARIVQNGSDTVEYYVTDRHGNTMATVDTSGEVTARYTYSDYGIVGEYGSYNTASAERNPFQYAGEYTTATGTQYLGARVYDPATMRFTTKDTAQLHNLYAYANANPIIMVDPSGQSGVVDHAVDVFVSVAGLLFAVMGFLLSVNVFGGGSITLKALAGVSTDAVITAAVFTEDARAGFRGDPVSRALSIVSMGVGLLTFGATVVASKAALTARKAQSGVRGLRSDTNIPLRSLSLTEEKEKAQRAMVNQAYEKYKKSAEEYEDLYSKYKAANEEYLEFDGLAKTVETRSEELQERLTVVNHFASDRSNCPIKRHSNRVSSALTNRLTKVDVFGDALEKKVIEKFEIAVNLNRKALQAQKVRDFQWDRYMTLESRTLQLGE